MAGLGLFETRDDFANEDTTDNFNAVEDGDSFMGIGL
jgi:hypothetical protein